jgi:hypothetical protein
MDTTTSNATFPPYVIRDLLATSFLRLLVYCRWALQVLQSAHGLVSGTQYKICSLISDMSGSDVVV